MIDKLVVYQISIRHEGEIDCAPFLATQVVVKIRVVNSYEV